MKNIDLVLKRLEEDLAKDKRVLNEYYAWYQKQLQLVAASEKVLSLYKNKK